MSTRGVVDDQLLRESLQDLYEQAPCGYLFTLPDGLITRVNQTFLTWTGYDRDELISHVRFQDLLTVPGRIFYENQYDPLLRMQGFVNEVAFDVLRRDSDPLPVLVSSVQRRDAEGSHLVTASVVFNATERRRYERELLDARRKAEQFAAIVRVASDAIVTISPDGTIELWNLGAERRFGYPAGVMIGRNIREFVSLEEAEFHRLLEGLKARRAVELETAVRHADGQLIEVSTALTPHQGLLGELSSVSAIMRDITERKALERLQQEFLAMASHELRNPVAVISGHAQIMQRLGAYREQSIGAIVRQADQLSRLINDLLLASQIAADRLDLQLTGIDLVEEASAAADQMRAVRPSIQVQKGPNRILVRADRQRLGQVFSNLLTNAIKYSPEGTDILVRISQAGREARVAVVDQGAGIPPEALPHLFNRFYRVASSAQRVQGLGLGLYISRRIVEAHGGTLSVESEPGRGSTFTVTLPVADGLKEPA